MGRINEADLDWEEGDEGTDTDPPFKRKRLGAAAGGGAIGTSLYELPPGASSWPYHHHTANEEAIYVLEGTGALRTPAGESPIEPGDYVTFPPDAEGAHRVHNPATADGSLRYLAISTMTEPDVTIYPDADAFGVFVGAPPGSRAERSFEGFYGMADDVEYRDVIKGSERTDG